MEAPAWRGLLFTAFLLNFVLVCQLLLLQPLVSASDGKLGNSADLFEKVSQNVKVKRYSEALDDLNAAIQADPKLSEAYYHRGSILRKLCRYNESEKNYKEFLELKPGNAAGEKELSQLLQAQSALDTALKLFDLGDYTKSLEFVDKVVLVFSPACSEAKLLKIKLFLATKDYSAAISETGYILKEDENNLDVLLLRGRAYYYLADHDVATRHFHRHSAKFRRLFDRITPMPVVSSSLNSVVATGNIIAAAAAAVSGSGSVHGAVTSAITHVAVTAFAIASGACLSTKVDFLWPKVEEQPGSLVLHGVDVTGYLIFNDAKVQKAIEFAKKAHHGQFRKTGDPYLTHCIHTGRILAALVPSTGNRAVDTVVAGILHDIVDDTCENLHSIEEEFGDEVAKLVAGVSRLSYINQLLRRHRRVNVNQGSLGHEEANKLRVMLLGMVDDPRVVLIKLADRLHNMRTIYALPLPKAQAVAQETLVIWCSLASRLGLWALKAELEDLCFAVLQPQMFLKLRSELASMWMPRGKVGSCRKISARANLKALDKINFTCYHDISVTMIDEATNMKELLEAVVPFDILVDKRKRTNYLYSLQRSMDDIQPKVVQDARNALASLVVCEEALEQELIISASYVPGMEVNLSSRLKSLYSIYSKMERKDISIEKVYDARALRVVVGDKNGTLHGPAVQCCYSLLNTVHKLWSPIDGEFDDYIVNPKPSGYQSLHTAVLGPDNSPLEVQIRTQRMHEYAENGLAAHWLYKENGNKIPSISSKNESEREVSSYFSDTEIQNSFVGDSHKKYSSMKAGHPVLRVEGSHLLAAVIIRVDEDGRKLLVAVSFGLAASEAVADRRSSFQIKRWEAYARLYKKVSDEWWCEPGHGDWCTCLEKYTLCRDGMYHKQDQFGRLLPTFIQVIDFTEQEKFEYWSIMSAIFEGKQIDSAASSSSSDLVTSISTEANINTKVHFLRAMLQWEEQLLSEANNFGQARQGREYYICRSSISLGEVAIICWPDGDIMRLRSGSTAADAAQRVGYEGKLVLVNGLLVLPCTELKDGDVVEVRV